MANRYWVGGTGDWDATAGSKWALTSGGAGGQAVPNSSDDVFFDANSGANTVTIGSGTAICDSLTMTGFAGTLAFGSNSITCGGSGSNTFVGATTYSVTGTPLINITGTGTLTIVAGAVTEANSISFTINNAASNAIGISGSVRNLTFSGTYTGNLTNAARTIYGNLTFKTGMTISAGASTQVFSATSGIQTITSAGLNLDFPINFNGTATYQLQDPLSVGTATNRTITLTSGTFDLNNNSVTLFGLFTSSGSLTRTIAFGTGQFYLTALTSNVWTVTGTLITITGTSPTVSLTANATTGERTFVHVPTTVSQALAINLNVTAGSANLGFGTGTQLINNLDFTGCTARIGNAGHSAECRFNIYGNLTMGVGMTAIAGTSTNTFRGTGTQLFTPNGVIFDQPFGFSGTGTVSLQGAFTTGTTRVVNLNSGTFITNGYSLTCGTFGFFNGTTKTLNIANSVVTITGGTSGSGFFGSTTGTTYNLSNAEIVFTTAGTTLLGGTESNSSTATVTMAGTGTLIIGAASQGTTIGTLRNTVQPCTISMLNTANSLDVTNFNIAGTVGNLVTFNSSVAGTARIVRRQSGGVVNAYYLNIQDVTASATGGTVWNAYNSTNVSNNTGWNFLIGNSGNFFLLF